ncbi:PMT6 (YGR199W) [Zygosaccharomyces parabailii]|uniref:Dolichyl-phosphate-mannose--protein mannosyltransferase n=1 Tax=Zygosaccharomyces bailii (strain CLIB 213 / ATCC 58445 / CBS 680 / BCRC 21525 / NBRC 1098 / NCYC 1416 / NRRL Y-2227) TaxID=1333698 RepID=A0A8J2T3Y6_ZYGB2|nr:PMT6 (YGR199W) [Zygosaccharomyces parabailii]CDF87471.1 BN860_07118g1_1 [Zygosaccharomyces bailii CLIB 213]
MAESEKLEEKGLAQPMAAPLVNTKVKWWLRFEGILSPLAYTTLGLCLRFHDIEKNNGVVWDEAHFGKFGSYYIKHEFYHDVHPPLGKMLVALTEWLAGFDGDFDFDSNKVYPENVNYKLMRQMNAFFGVLCCPLAYWTAKNMGFNLLTTHLVALMITLEHSYITISKFILLDSMLLFFTISTFACMVKLYTLRKQAFTKPWSLWMWLTGVSIGCVCSVKWVGLFVTVVVGFYTILELFIMRFDSTMSKYDYMRHWMIRVLNLIVSPFLIYLFCFMIHFTLLYKSGTGDAATNTLFQINLEGNEIYSGPRTVVFGSHISIRSHGLSPNLLHSHVQTYPEGSNQNQVTGYGFADENNVWQVRFSRSSGVVWNENATSSDKLVPITDGTEIRLFHKEQEINLHSHEIPSHVSKGNFEVSGYGSESIGDSKDDWVVEIVRQLDSADATYPKEEYDVLHPLSTFFRLRHKDLGCYLTSTGFSYPAWGFQQAEIVCKYSWSKHDKSTWWNVEEHWNENLDINADYVPPKSKFWTDFVMINFAMASSNNALVEDGDKYDNLASKAWEWPTLHKGLRMCTWGVDNTRYYLMGSPFNTWLSTVSLVVFLIIMAKLLYQWRRQTVAITEDQFWSLTIQGVMPFTAWGTHYMPFVTMGRVTYVHHYLPALYFAVLVFGFVVDYLLRCSKKLIKYAVYLILFSGCISCYIYFSPMCQGMTGMWTNYLYLQWFKPWDIA